MSYKPGIAIAPGETLLEVMEDREVSVETIIERLNITRDDFSKLLQGEIPLTKAYARELEQELNIPATFWENLEQQYQEAKRRLQEKS